MVQGWQGALLSVPLENDTAEQQEGEDKLLELLIHGGHGVIEAFSPDPPEEQMLM